MPEVVFYDVSSVNDTLLQYAIIVSRYKGKWVFCKNKNRAWELPGGHREQGETILQAAKRELYEETGATDYEITPVCAYSINQYGMIFYADIKRLGDLPESEIEKTGLFDGIPEPLSFPLYHLKIFKMAEEALGLKFNIGQGF